MKYTPWTTKEIEVLKRGYAMGFCSTNEIWKSLLPGRTNAAIACKAQQYGFATRSYKNWLPEEDKLIATVIENLAKELRTSTRQLMGHIASLHQTKSRKKDASHAELGHKSIGIQGDAR